MDEEKEEKKEEIDTEISKKNINITEKLRKNPWIISTFVCGVLVVVLLISTIFGGVTGNVISENDAGEKVINFFTEMGYDGLTLDSVKEVSGVYEIDLIYEGKTSPIYLTKDGKNIISSLTSIEQESSSDSNTQTEVPKSDNPEVELFIWSYCPYGVQAQAPFAEVASLLKDNADFKVVLYYDGHGEFETQQNKIQECIQKNYKEKYWDYASKFVEEIYPKCSSSRTEECDKTESVALMNSLGIDSSAVMSCVESQGDALLSESSARAKELGITGSPSLIINGVKVNPSSRTANAFKDSVCSSFNNVPEICGTELDSTSTAASGNC